MSDISQLEALGTAIEDVSGTVKMASGTRTEHSHWMVHVRRAISWILEKTKKQQQRKALKVCESVSLGDKRFVAVVQVAHERFLIGGAPSSVSMLARLEPVSFADVLRSSQGAGQP